MAQLCKRKARFHVCKHTCIDTRTHTENKYFPYINGNKDGRDGADPAQPGSKEEDTHSGYNGVHKTMISCAVAAYWLNVHLRLSLDYHNIGLQGEKVRITGRKEVSMCVERAHSIETREYIEIYICVVDKKVQRFNALKEFIQGIISL